MYSIIIIRYAEPWHWDERMTDDVQDYELLLGMLSLVTEMNAWQSVFCIYFSGPTVSWRRPAGGPGRGGRGGGGGDGAGVGGILILFIEVSPTIFIPNKCQSNHGAATDSAWIF